MKAIILAAADPSGIYGFPENSKPKCLFHFSGEVLLERQVRILKDAGINNIRVVVCYKKEMIAKFNDEKKLGLLLVHNPTAESDYKSGTAWAKGMESVRSGFQGIDDDILIIPGDVYLRKEGLKKTLDDKHPCAAVWGGAGIQLFKISKGKLPLLKKYKSRRVGLGWTLHDFCVANGVKIVTEIHDVDVYSTTDEART